MRVIRVIMYESDDQAKLDHQLSKSLQDGQYDLATTITVATIPDEERQLPWYRNMLYFLNQAARVKQSLSGPPVGDPLIFGDEEQANAQADQV